jgi:hypothetical protein
MGVEDNRKEGERQKNFREFVNEAGSPLRTCEDDNIINE